ncbi:MAG TPA: enoyl-CoA hydratase family protein [Actinoplanes sp.]|nr:enoyl-CoA hydratase family protein [Actinoplanes sp.]
MTELVRAVVREQVATLTLDSPHNRNALSEQLVAELTDRLGQAAADPSVRAVVLTNAGRVFCAGGDLKAAGSGSMASSTSGIMALLVGIVDLPKPVIAAIRGHVRAGGMGLVGACDLAVADPSASFAFTEARIGVAPAVISLTTLDLMDPRAAARYYLTGETFDAETAARIGLITAAAPEGRLDEIVEGLIAAIRETSPQGSAETKRLLTAQRRERIAARADEMAALSAKLFASPEAQEGIHAFLERRPPAWRSSA